MIERITRIYADNASTFYDYRTNERQSQRARILVIVITAAIFSVLCPISSTEALSAAITVQAILIGFGFSVMFFLVQDTRPPSGDHSGDNISLERELDNEQVELLSKELFWNISYFNMVAFASLIVALSLMIPNVWDRAQVIVDRAPWEALEVVDLSVPALIFPAAAQFLLMLFGLESGFTFVRTVGRVNFLFEQRMGHSG